MSERVVVTGAQGFLGRYVVDHLLARPDVEVLGVGRSALDRDAFTHAVHWGHLAVRAPLPAAMRDRLASERYRYVSLDLRETAELVRVLGSFTPTAIIHLAAALRDQPLDELLASNVGAAASLLDALVGARLEGCRVVLGSTGGVYGSMPASELPLRESARGTPVDMYSLTKQTSEDATRILADRHGLRVVWARLFNLVGAGQDERHFFGRVAAQLAAIRAGLRPPELELGDLDCTRDFVDVRDAARAVWCLARGGEPGLAYNIASGHETRIADALALLLDVSGLAGTIEVRHVSHRANDVPRHVADISRLRALGSEPAIALHDSARTTLDYYLDEVARCMHGDRVRDAGARSIAAVSVQDRAHYDVEVTRGLVGELHARLAQRYPGRHLALLTDGRVWELYGRAVVERARAAGLAIDPVIVPEGERSKSPERYLEIIERLHHGRLDRRGVLVNLGGGLVIDLGGFVAATYLRGIDYVNVPTTLLAQHDAAIGGKVAVNAAWGTKNFLGAFHHPSAVLCDPDVLGTLPSRELSAGVAEAIKIALCGEPDLFRLLELEVDDVRAADPETLARVVRLAAARKISLLAPDPYEIDLRRVLNLGHTVGHALEVEYAHAEILHGEAVAFGIAVATAVALHRGICARIDAHRIFALLAAYELPPPIPQARAFGALRRLDDIRLVRGQRLNYVMPTGIAGVTIDAEVSDRELVRAVEYVFDHAIARGLRSERLA